jgi:hypothetical protein
VKENKGYCFTPYIVGNADPAFATIPDHHRQRLDGLRAYWEQEAQKRADERTAGLATTEPGKDETSNSETLNELLREFDKISPDKQDGQPSKSDWSLWPSTV